MLILQAKLLIYTYMNTAILGIVALVVLALVGWAIAEAKYKAISYERNAEEEAAEAHAAQLLHENGYTELSIKDVIKTISTKGFSAV